MISVQTMDGELVKVLKNIGNSEFGLHQLFGFISENKAKEREIVRKRQGFEFTRDNWLCHFKIDAKNDGSKLSLSSISDCDVEELEDNTWKLSTPVGDFQLSSVMDGKISPLLEDHEDTNRWMNRLIEIVFILTFALIPMLYLMQDTPVEEKEEEKKSEPITVKIVKPVNTVNVAPKAPAMKVKPLTKQQKAHRAVKRNLGFLGLVGSSKIKNATGGVPQKLKKATAGAGAGGDAGSGGELLTGLGKGLKKTTVGNTGVAGLGGIGTKGAGGGKGGYGNTMVASGEGNGISAIGISSNEIVLDGGLSRYAINATIAKYINQVRRCYEEQLKLIPSLEGMVTVNFEIGGNGMLNYSRVKKSSLGNKNVETCITKKMMGWQFPKPKGGTNVNVNYPFMLRPVGS
jgi:hypothetical protein